MRELHLEDQAIDLRASVLSICTDRVSLDERLATTRRLITMSIAGQGETEPIARRRKPAVNKRVRDSREQPYFRVLFKSNGTDNSLPKRIIVPDEKIGLAKPAMENLLERNK